MSLAPLKPYQWNISRVIYRGRDLCLTYVKSPTKSPSRNIRPNCELITELACHKVAGDVGPFLVCWSPFVLCSCLPLCMINRIICTAASQPASPWTTVLPSRVSALHAAPLSRGQAWVSPGGTCWHLGTSRCRRERLDVRRDCGY